MQTRNRHPSQQDKTQVELTEKELLVLVTLYQDLIKRDAGRHPSLAAYWALRARIMLDGIHKIQKAQITEREERDVLGVTR